MLLTFLGVLFATILWTGLCGLGGVMMWRGLKVASNHAFAKGKLDEKGIKSVVSDTSKILN